MPSLFTPEPTENATPLTCAAGKLDDHCEIVPCHAEPLPPVVDGAPSFTNCAEPFVSQRSCP
jgi:hypothetical protein